MNKRLVKILSATIGAVMLAGTFTAGVSAPVTTVIAADSTTTQMIKNLFDANFYADKYPDLKAAFGTDAAKLWKHFTQYGMNEGRMLNANFDPKAYIEAYPDIKNYCNGDYKKAYEHYVMHGIKENRPLTTYDAINKKKAEEEAARRAAEEAAREEEERRKAAERKTVNIGHGLKVDLNEDQYNHCTIGIFASGYGFGPVGYGAYIDDDLVASSNGYTEYGSYPYATVTVNNGRIWENTYPYYGPYYYNDYDYNYDWWDYYGKDWGWDWDSSWNIPWLY